MGMGRMRLKVMAEEMRDEEVTLVLLDTGGKNIDFGSSFDKGS